MKSSPKPSRVSNITNFNTEDTTSNQDDTFMKGDDIGTPPPSGLENRTKGFPRCSKEDRSKGHGNAFKKEAASADVAAASTGKPSKDFVPAFDRITPNAVGSEIGDKETM